MKTSYLYLIFFLLFVACQGENRRVWQERMEDAVVESVRKQQMRERFVCLQRAMDSASILVDSMLRAEALDLPFALPSLFEGSAQGANELQNGKPKRPKLLPITDSSGAKPLFE